MDISTTLAMIVQNPDVYKDRLHGETLIEGFMRWGREVRWIIKVLMTFSPLRAITTDVVAQWLLVHLLNQVMNVPPETRLPSDVLIRLYGYTKCGDKGGGEAFRVGTPGAFDAESVNASDI